MLFLKSHMSTVQQMTEVAFDRLSKKLVLRRYKGTNFILFPCTLLSCLTRVWLACPFTLSFHHARRDPYIQRTSVLLFISTWSCFQRDLSWKTPVRIMYLVTCWPKSSGPLACSYLKKLCSELVSNSSC